MDYKTTVGIEVHCELKTKTKMFSRALNGYGTTANSNITLVDLAYPGTLPTVNKQAVSLALRAALVLNCTINKEVSFDRKNYFYPDLSKGYQITQARNPIGINGYILIPGELGPKKIRIHDIHIEEDTAKSVHTGASSILDFNRAGVPLIEIVTEPDMHSKEDAINYVEKLRELLLYADISDCKIEEGSMRCDVNVSISKTEVLGTRAEIKNIGSISSVGLAVTNETIRQAALYEKGEVLKEETRRFDDHTNQTILMRVKETGNDYRYFPEPDIPAFILTDEDIELALSNIPVLPNIRREQYKLAGMSDINSNKLIQNRSLSDFLLEVTELDSSTNLVYASNILLGDVSAYLNKNLISIKDTKLSPSKLIKIINLLETKKITNAILKEILVDLLETDNSVDDLIKTHGIVQISNEDLTNIITNIIKNNASSVNDYKNGNERALKYLIGIIMKETKGGANPLIASEILINLLKQ
ncbi:MAG: Asp-tRNA(Asn)/Glu-tRNA(Gln) amidotransferase subunit GatB [Bacilli bacterium]